jgi:hypothetical protein
MFYNPLIIRESKHMNYDEFSNKVDELGISKSDFLKHLDMSVPTMSHWSSKDEIPQVVALYLDLLIQVKQLQNKFNLVFGELLPKVLIENEELSMVQPRLRRGPFTFDRYARCDHPTCKRPHRRKPGDRFEQLCDGGKLRQRHAQRFYS